MKSKIFSFHSILIASFVFSIFFTVMPAIASAYTLSCTDGTTGCGMVGSYNMGIAKCTLTGPDTYGGNRILGGQVCAIDGADTPGYYMTGTGEPNGSTPYFSYTGSTPPGWTYTKTYFSHSSIPSGEFSDDPYHNMKFFSGPATINLYNGEDDTSYLQVGANILQWMGCNALVTDVKKSGCPATILGGGGSNITAWPGDAITFTVTNMLRPNNGTGQWGVGTANVTLGSVTSCYTKAYFDSVGGRGSAGPSITYHPTNVPGECAPEPVVCTINSFTGPGSVNSGSSATLSFNLSSTNGTPSWSIANITTPSLVTTPASGSNVGSVTATTGNLTSTQTYRLTCGSPAVTADATVVVGSPSIQGSWPTSTSVTPGTPTSVSFKYWNGGPTGTTLNITSCKVEAGPGVIINSVSSCPPVALPGQNLAGQ